MTTRAGSAAISLQAKKELVQRLFAPQLARKGPQAHSMLDHSIYSYDDLRTAYLEQVHKLHPDKHAGSTLKKSDTAAIKEEKKRQFVDLQEAWARYEEVAKMINRVANGKDADSANFTMFGVGCSFSDNEEEKSLRNEIMDQASRGWFSAGLISETQNTKGLNGSKSNAYRSTSLIDDEMFALERDDKKWKTKESPSKQGTASEETGTSKPSLVSHLIRRPRR